MISQKTPSDSSHRLKLLFTVFLLFWGIAAVLYGVVFGWKLGTPEFTIPGNGWNPPFWVVWPLAVFALMVAGIHGFGTLTVKLLRVREPDFNGLRKAETELMGMVNRLLLGFVVQGLVIFVLGVLQLYPWGLLLLVVPLGFPMVWRQWGKDGELCLRLLQKSLKIGAWPLLIPSGVLGAVLVLAALGPALESDGLRYHLFGPQEYLKAGGIVLIPHNALTNLPFLAQMHTVVALAWGGTYGDSAAQLLHVGAWMLLGPLAYGLARMLQGTLGLAEDFDAIRWATASAAVVQTIPVAASIAPWPFVDLFTVVLTLGGCLALISWVATTQSGMTESFWAAVGFGGAIATKTTALVPAFWAGVLILFLSVRRKSILPVLLYAGLVLLIPAPWFAKAAMHHGNPVHPLGYSVFGSPEWDESTDAFYKDKVREKGFQPLGLPNLLMTPFDITTRWVTDRFGRVPEGVEPAAYRNPAAVPVVQRFFNTVSPGFEDQNPGPGFLALLPAALGLMGLFVLKRQWGVLAVLVMQGLFAWGLWYASYQSVRFLVVPLGLGILAGGVFLQAMTREQEKIVRVITVVLMGLLATLQASWVLQYHGSTVPGRSARGNPVYTALGFQDREAVRERNVRLYTIFQLAMLEWESLPESGEDSKPGILLLGHYQGFHARFPIVSGDFFDRPPVLDGIRQTRNTAELIVWLRKEKNVRFVLYDAGELSLYTAAYFQPRFTPDEWERFRDFESHLRQNPNAILHQIPEKNQYLIDLEKLPTL
ncbi:MAG: hypothetical protein SFY68_05960 [Candidatus Sumerlaeia bacterium]|nr:hypothetical protein [Candidatus Sumerlaeia bacterium]